MKRSSFLLSSLLLLVAASRATAQDVRYYEDGGITYRETTQTVRRPIPHTEMQSRDVTYYREKYTTDLQDVTRTYQVPVTQYVYEPRVENRWNPFTQPTLTYRMVPRTHWETKYRDREDSGRPPRSGARNRHAASAGDNAQDRRGQSGQPGRRRHDQPQCRYVGRATRRSAGGIDLQRLDARTWAARRFGRWRVEARPDQPGRTPTGVGRRDAASLTRPA